MTREENELLTRTDAGTPAGELLRRYWQPAALSEELPLGGAPLPVTLLGEDLVLFRDETGAPALLGLHCSHRGADLSYGRLEDGGLRCIYHGWLYDRRGRCLDQPGEPAGGEHRDAIRHPAYPCVERAGAIFAYMGPGEPPLFPNYEFLTAPDERCFAIKLLSACNYLQGNEGNIDLAHLSFLHYNSRVWDAGPPVEEGRLSSRGIAPERESFEIELTDYGLKSYKIRRTDGDQYVLFMTEFVLPNFTCFFGQQYRNDGSFSVNWHVPIDDERHWKYTFIFSRTGPIDKEMTRRQRAEVTSEYGPMRHRGNRYLQDRASMRNESYSGIGFNFQVQDLCVTEGMGPIQDRAAEHLTAMDRSVVLARKVMLAAIRDLQEGREPANVVREPSRNYFILDACADVVPNSRPWKEHAEEKARRVTAALDR